MYGVVYVCIGPSTALGLRARAVLKTSGTVSPNTDLPASE